MYDKVIFTSSDSDVGSPQSSDSSPFSNQITNDNLNKSVNALTNKHLLRHGRVLESILTRGEELDHCSIHTKPDSIIDNDLLAFCNENNDVTFTFDKAEQKNQVDRSFCNQESKPSLKELREVMLSDLESYRESDEIQDFDHAIQNTLKPSLHASRILKEAVIKTIISDPQNENKIKNDSPIAPSAAKRNQLRATATAFSNCSTFVNSPNHSFSNEIPLGCVAIVSQQQKHDMEQFECGEPIEVQKTDKIKFDQETLFNGSTVSNQSNTKVKGSTFATMSSSRTTSTINDIVVFPHDILFGGQLTENDENQDHQEIRLMDIFIEWISSIIIIICAILPILIWNDELIKQFSH